MRSLLVLWILLLPAAAQAFNGSPQAPAPSIVVAPPGETQELVLRDGTRAFGRVERVEGGRVTFRTTAGAAIEVDASQVVSVGPAAGRLHGGEYWAADPNPTRLFFAPTGRSLKRGTGYFGMYEIFMPFVQVGITDRVSIGGGTPLIFGGGSEHPFWVTPKVRVLASKSTEASVGILHFMNVGDGSFGIAYGVLTQGNTDSAVTLGLGYAYERYGENEGSGVVMVGGEHRVRRGVKLVTENYFFSGGGIASGGVRLFGDRLAADLGLVVPLGAGDVIVFPIVNFVWKFSSN